MIRLFKNSKQKRRFMKSFFPIALISVLWQACEISHSIPFDFPDYEPVLIIHAVASPQSGATARIQYNQPAGGIQGEAPDLPPLEAYILQEGKPVNRFLQDSVSMIKVGRDEVQRAFFSIPPDSLNLVPDLPYTLQVIDRSNNQIYKSSAVYLPPEPNVEDLKIDCSATNNKCSFSVETGAVQEIIAAISIKVKYPDIMFTDEYYRSQNEQVFNYNLIYPDLDRWESYQTGSSFSRYVRTSQDSATLAMKVNIHTAYVSPEIAELIREINENYALGEDIFATLRPFYSNFTNAVGVFGLYNEEIRKIEF